MSCGILPGENHSGHHACWPDYPALAAAARKWIGERIPQRTLTGFAYDSALLDVMQALGLKP